MAKKTQAVKPRGGKKPGAGRPRQLTLDQEQEIARQYHQRMAAWAWAKVWAGDPIIQERRTLDAQMRELAATHAALAPDDELIHFHPHVRLEMQQLQAQINKLPNKSQRTPKRAKGPRARFIRELAKEWKVSRRRIVTCINKF